MKRFFILLFCAILCVSFSACSAGSPQPTQNSEEPSLPQQTSEPISTQASIEEPVLDPYVAMLMSSHYYDKSAESNEFTYLVYTSSRDDTGYVIIKEYTGSSEAVVIPDTLDGYPVIGMYQSIFEKCDFVTDIVFPESLRTVFFYTNSDFYTCMTNTQWYQNQPDGVYYAGNIAVGYKGEMPANTTLTFREGTLGIGGGAFRLQKNLVGIEIPESMVMISDDAFAGCGLVELTIPSTLQYYFGAFGTCNELTRVTFEEGVKEIRGTISGDKLSEVILPSTLVTIGERAFMRCEGLKTIVLPDSVRTIEELAFYGSGLSHIELNDGLETIEKEAFMQCNDLKSVFIPASVTKIGIRSFGFLWEDALVDGFVAYFEEEGSPMEYLEKNGITCEIGSPS